MNDHDTYLRLVAQSSLLGEISPRLRTVSFDLSDDGKGLKARFEYDGEPTDDERECASVVMTNIISHYSTNHSPYEEQIICNEYPNTPNFLRLVVYFRNEDEWNEWTKK